MFCGLTASSSTSLASTTSRLLDPVQPPVQSANASRAAATGSLARHPPGDRRGPASPEERVRRAFLRDGRLIGIPTQRSKRLVVLDLVAQDFEPGRRYPEREVNRRLRAYHDDVAAMRRHLVDEGFLRRERGEYWRIGGSFPVG